MARYEDQPEVPGIIQRVRFVPLVLGVTSLLVVLAAIFSRDPISDGATLAHVPEARLVYPVGYMLMAPLSTVLDVLTLLSARQHIALLVTILVCYGAWWLHTGRFALLHIAPRRRWLREAARAGIGFTALVMLYAAAVLLPRPMAQLERSPDILAIDFHAHTMYSHDGRPRWTPEDVRRWHSDAGFDVAYISDHRTFEGARDGWTNNPQRSGDKTVLIPAIEVGWRGEHVNVLDADRMYKGLLTESLRDIDEKALQLSSALATNEPVLIETLPGNPRNIIAANGPGTEGIRAIELVDGSPKGLGQTRRERAEIAHLSDSLNLALVAGSDNHGWGRTAAGWTLMYIQNWRAMPPGNLSVQISRILRGGGRASTRVVSRYIADSDGPAALPFTVPIVAWGMLRTLSGEERVVWLVWAALIFLAWKLGGMRTRREPA